MTLRPLSQTGFHRIPKSPLQRNFEEGGVPVTRRGVPDLLNETLTDTVLHPTKGFRSVSPKRLRAAAVLANIRRGGSADLASVRGFLNH